MITSNYLNYGNSLEYLDEFVSSLSGNSILKKELIENLEGKTEQSTRCLIEIIKSYKGYRTKKVDIENLKYDIDNSLELQILFRSLQCRGFSFKVHEKIDLKGDSLREKMNLRIALMPDDGLFYPPKVKRYLRRVGNNHYIHNGYRSIAFALGSRTDKAWYIFVLQSDIAFRKPSYIKEHFRGWRKVLFANIINLAKRETETIYLCRAKDVLKCCHPGFLMPKKLPASWKIIYDETAKYFNMHTVCLGEYVDIQTFENIQSVYTNIFYKIDLSSKVLQIL